MPLKLAKVVLDVSLVYSYKKMKQSLKLFRTKSKKKKNAIISPAGTKKKKKRELPIEYNTLLQCTLIVDKNLHSSLLIVLTKYENSIVL